MRRPKHDSVRDDGRSEKYFHIVLNIADDDLDPYQYRLLGHYRRVCGESGICWEGTRTTAKICKMSVGKVSQTRKELEQLGYIAIKIEANETLHITVIDRWAENIARYNKRSSGEHPVHDMNTSVHQVNTPVHDMNERITLKEEPKKKSNTRGRVTSTTSNKKDWSAADALIVAWSEAMGYAGSDLGATFTSEANRKKAHEMLSWDAPATPEEVRRAVILKRKTGKDYPFPFLVADIPMLRAQKRLSAPAEPANPLDLSQWIVNAFEAEKQ